VVVVGKSIFGCVTINAGENEFSSSRN